MVHRRDIEKHIETFINYYRKYDTYPQGIPIP